jgi:hypothetical protein
LLRDVRRGSPNTKWLGVNNILITRRIYDTAARRRLSPIVGWKEVGVVVVGGMDADLPGEIITLRDWIFQWMRNDDPSSRGPPRLIASKKKNVAYIYI